MDKLYPQAEDLNFVLCDEIRQEIGNKISLMGVYSGGDLIVPKKDDKKHVVASLSFFFGFTNGEGIFEGKFVIKDPTGKVILTNPIKELKKEKDKGMNFVAAVKPFHLTIGKYTVSLWLDDHEFINTFDVKEGDENGNLLTD